MYIQLSLVYIHTSRAPLLFLCYINDLPTCNVGLYIYDVMLHYTIHTEIDCINFLLGTETGTCLSTLTNITI